MCGDVTSQASASLYGRQSTADTVSYTHLDVYKRQLVDLDLTQKQIEAGAGINQPSISRILNGSQADVSYAAGKRLEAFVAQMTSIDKQAA